VPQSKKTFEVQRAQCREQRAGSRKQKAPYNVVVVVKSTRLPLFLSSYHSQHRFRRGSVVVVMVVVVVVVVVVALVVVVAVGRGGSSCGASRHINS
jgi:protein-S-isoprenylcysteine O-methyltransferase Ste14